MLLLATLKLCGQRIHYLDRKGQRLFVVREFDVKVLRCAPAPGIIGKRALGASEQAIRAGIRTTILSLNLVPESASKKEIKLLKKSQVLGRRAPSCMLLSGEHMHALLVAFERFEHAKAFKEALSELGAVRIGAEEDNRGGCAGFTDSEEDDIEEEEEEESADEGCDLDMRDFPSPSVASPSSVRRTRSPSSASPSSVRRARSPLDFANPTDPSREVETPTLGASRAIQGSYTTNAAKRLFSGRESPVEDVAAWIPPPSNLSHQLPLDLQIIPRPQPMRRFPSAPQPDNVILQSAPGLQQTHSFAETSLNLPSRDVFAHVALPASASRLQRCRPLVESSSALPSSDSFVFQPHPIGYRSLSRSRSTSVVDMYRAKSTSLISARSESFPESFSLGDSRFTPPMSTPKRKATEDSCSTWSDVPVPADTELINTTVSPLGKGLSLLTLECGSLSSDASGGCCEGSVLREHPHDEKDMSPMFGSEDTTEYQGLSSFCLSPHSPTTDGSSKRRKTESFDLLLLPVGDAVEPDRCYRRCSFSVSDQLIRQASISSSSSSSSSSSRGSFSPSSFSSFSSGTSFSLDLRVQRSFSLDMHEQRPPSPKNVHLPVARPSHTDESVRITTPLAFTYNHVAVATVVSN